MKVSGMKWAFVVALLLGCMMMTTQGWSQERDWTGNVNFMFGAKALDKDDWNPTHEQGEFGIEIDFGKKSWPVSIAIDILAAVGEGTITTRYTDGSIRTFDVETTTTEIDLGIRKIWQPTPLIRPFLGGGIGFIGAETERDLLFGKASNDDSAVGYWLNGGIYITLNELVNLGVEARISGADVEYNNVKGDAGGGHFGFFVGFHI